MTISSQASSAGFTVIKWLAVALVILWLFREIFPSLAELEQTGVKTGAKDATNTAVDAGKGAYVGISQGIGEQLGLPDDLTKYGFGSIPMLVAGIQKFLGISSPAPSLPTASAAAAGVTSLGAAALSGGTLGGVDFSQYAEAYIPQAPTNGEQYAIPSN